MTSNFVKIQWNRLGNVRAHHSSKGTIRFVKLFSQLHLRSCMWARGCPKKHVLLCSSPSKVLKPLAKGTRFEKGARELFSTTGSTQALQEGCGHLADGTDISRCRGAPLTQSPRSTLEPTWLRCVLPPHPTRSLPALRRPSRKQLLSVRTCPPLRRLCGLHPERSMPDSPGWPSAAPHPSIQRISYIPQMVPPTALALTLTSFFLHRMVQR